MAKTIWTQTNSNGRRVHWESKLGPENLILRCVVCGKQFKGHRSWQAEMRAAREKAAAHGETH